MLAAVGALVLVVTNPLIASAATPGVGDVSDAMRYDVAGPIGTPLAGLSGTDDQTQTVAAPFPINFFGTASSGICVTTNGGFYPVPTAADSCSDTYDLDLENLALQSQAAMIAALASDLNLGNCADNTFDGFGIPCEIYFGTTTVAGRDAFVITWYRVPMYTSNNDPALSKHIPDRDREACDGRRDGRLGLRHRVQLRQPHRRGRRLLDSGPHQ